MSNIVKGLPEELRFNSVSLPDSVMSYSVKVAPQNLTSVTSQTYTVNPTNVTGASIKEINVPSTQINFDIPTSGSPYTWIDTAKSTISFRVGYTRAEGGTTIGNICSANLRGCAMNFFARLFETSATGTIITDVPQIHLAHQNDLMMNMSPQEMDALALPFGFNAEAPASNSLNANTGHSLSTIYGGTQTISTSETEWYSYELPLPSPLLGKFARGMMPIGKVSKLTLSLVTDTTAPITLNFSAAAPASSSSSFSFVIQDLALNLSYVDLGAEASALLGGGSSILHGITHRVSSSTIASGTTGQVSVLMGLRGSSVRSLYTRVVENTISTAGSANGIFDSKLLLSNGVNYFLGGKDRVPPNPLDVLRQPASVYMRALQAANSFSDRQYKMASTPQSFCIYTATGSSIPSGSDFYVSSSTTTNTSLASFVFGMPLQKVSKSRILDGYNFQLGNHFFEANLAIASTNNLTLYFIAECDCIYVFEGGDIQVRI